MSRALIAMSGGVDSSVAAYIMKEKGFDCVGATMKLFGDGDIGAAREHSCCSLEDVLDARSVADSLGMPHYVFNFADRFREEVIDKFIHAYENGMTPNPCIDCNRYLKFEKLFLRAREMDCDYVVTGHYARIEKDENTGRYLLKKAIDEDKDQSYVLYAMTQEQLAHVLLPLGGMTKPDVRAIAEANGFVNAKKHDSQDICFVQGESYAEFIERHTGRVYPPGDFVDTEGNVLGRHKGIIRYTVGQRRHLGVPAAERLYVAAVNPGDNTVTLATGGGKFSNVLTAHDINLISVPAIEQPMRVKVRTRYHQKEQWATAVQTDEDSLRVEFDEPQRAIAAGQAVVMYDGDVVVGGGTIE
ncbi:MAG: tRNA 2-thiouridine(34) synthase MnmA [Oscillospiraceae bacterium]|nr:tRNA 2-thiouridine(34) synthase MnmA [Oscillospiraceae bacterium]